MLLNTSLTVVAPFPRPQAVTCGAGSGRAGLATDVMAFADPPHPARRPATATAAPTWQRRLRLREPGWRLFPESATGSVAMLKGDVVLPTLRPAQELVTPQPDIPVAG